MNRSTNSSFYRPGEMDLSITLRNDEIMALLSSRSARQNNSVFADSMDVTQSVVRASSTNKQKADELYALFLDVLKGHKGNLDFDAVHDFVQACSDTLDVVQEDAPEAAKTATVSSQDPFAWLQTERDIWRLIQSLYRDRQKDTGMDCDEDLDLMRSEKTIVEFLYLNNSVLREYQLIVDWLELCAGERMSAQVGHFTDRTVAWENTLHQFQNPQKNVFNTNRNLVQSMDPDAPTREKRALHDLDAEDQSRLLRAVFVKIRQGRLEEAQSICEHCGQPWQAAILEGWRLCHDPNYYELDAGAEKLPLEGNPHRDIWKRCAWQKADTKTLDEYSRAIPAVFCGHLEALVNACSTWADLLWAYFKVQIDIRVEFEIRQCSMKSYHPMPEQYWNNKMSLEQIFDELAASKNDLIRLEAKNKMNCISRHVILDDIEGLLKVFEQWLDTEVLPPQTLRFLSHVVLFLRQIERIHAEEVGDKVLRAFVEHLIMLRNPQLVAFYTSTLPKETQVVLYAQFLDAVTETDDRRVCLEEALNAGLDIDRITQYVVESVRHREQPGDRQREQSGDLTELDLLKISALEYLQFYPLHRGELLYQSNALIRQFLAGENVEGVRKTLQAVPPDSVRVISDVYGTVPEMPYREECSIKENICYAAYLAAVDAFNQWTHLFHNKPKPPQADKHANNFTEKMAFELKEQEHQAAVDRWRAELDDLQKVATGMLYNVLLFPDQGWLIDPEWTAAKAFELEDEEWQNRLIQMNALRSICVPEIVILLHKCLHQSGDYQECLRLVDEVAAENRKLYECYASHKMSEFLHMVAESSLALLNAKCDPWGYSNV